MWVIPEDLGNFSPKKEKNLGEQKFAHLSVSNFRGRVQVDHLVSSEDLKFNRNLLIFSTEHSEERLFSSLFFNYRYVHFLPVFERSQTD
jgi:hypothetical protein